MRRSRGGPSRRTVLAAAALAAAPLHATTLAAGEAVDWPTLTLLDGRQIAPAQWAGTAAIVVFWASWCGYCKRHLDRVARLQAASAGQPLRIVAVAVASPEGDVRREAAARGYPFAVAFAGGDALRARFTSRRTVPYTVLVGRDGRLRQAIPGEMSDDDVAGLAASVLANRMNHG